MTDGAGAPAHWSLPVCTFRVTRDGQPQDDLGFRCEGGPADAAETVAAAVADVAARAEAVAGLAPGRTEAELHVFGYVGDGAVLSFTADQLVELARAGARLRLTASTSER